jgi:hypothetical protein
MERLTKERHAAITARCGAATPGPWREKLHNEDYGQGYGETTYFVDMGDLLKIGIGSDNAKCELLYANTAFIAHAREDIPATDAEITALKAENAQLRKERDAANEEILKLQKRIVYWSEHIEKGESNASNV